MRAEGTKEVWLDDIPTRSPTWYAMDNVRSLLELRQAHLKEVGLTQNQETMTLHNLITLDLIEIIV